MASSTILSACKRKLPAQAPPRLIPNRLHPRPPAHPHTRPPIPLPPRLPSHQVPRLPKLPPHTPNNHPYYPNTDPANPATADPAGRRHLARHWPDQFLLVSQRPVIAWRSPPQPDKNPDLLTDQTQHDRYLEFPAQAGQYIWQVAALDRQDVVMFFSVYWRFSKPLSPSVTPTMTEQPTEGGVNTIITIDPCIELSNLPEV